MRDARDEAIDRWISWAEKCDQQGSLLNPYRFALANAKPYLVVSAEPKMRARACFDNAAMLTHYEHRYVEGFSDTGIHHAWNLCEDGICRDFTWDDPGEQVFFGVEIPTEVVLAVAQSRVWATSHGVLEGLLQFSESWLRRKKIAKLLGLETVGRVQA